MSSQAPSWPLVRAIIRIVTAAPGGGLHRASLAGLVHLPPHGEAFKTALMIAYRKREIDFCGQYAVRPPAITTTERKRP
jgi:hypothetical protein